MTIQRLSSVTLGVQDVERSRNFYAAVGFSRRFEDKATVAFESEGMLLVLRPWDVLADEFGVAPQGAGFRGFHLTCLFDSEEAVDAAYEGWIGAGGVGVRQPSSRPWGGHAAVVADPDAHLWELCTATQFPAERPTAGSTQEA
ncbi:hypothetical protein GA0111570_10750 [Raineyella antarctica]|uniref:VOC domain-containing protein n=1 Tax=Raineyella antarctica TaxID=1577474 RepID=A0A1G6H6P6_9ACTN|nr:VOC family protein [Raineyella antarctica]SDB89950.1 hypothetical protein GA0111570_10750 [Raineyella antarctica]